MASFYHYNSSYTSSSSSHTHPTLSTNHTGRGRRAPRLSQNSSKQQHFRAARKEEEPIVVTSFRLRYEACRSFDLDDDLEFCPNLLTENDVFSINSGSSDRSSLSSNSPESSPQSHQVSPSSFTLSSNSLPYVSTSSKNHSILKSDQPTSTRMRNAIPIVNPISGCTTPSPGRQPQSFGRKW
ncbi:hypothetical protein K3495_g1913 [Podosphaera aphanis]|nr:hypothetical protein K3495_g1913 [Podosphaera aphanis]